MNKIFLLSLVLILALSVRANDTTTKVKTLPSVELKDINGNKVNIQDYGKTGKITIISFWATWCTPCIKELNNILEVYDEWQEKYKCELVAVSIDDSRNVPKVKPTVNALGWPYTVLTDENKDLARALNVNNPPQVFLLDSTGNIVYTHTGYTEGAEFELEEQIKLLVK